MNSPTAGDRTARHLTPRDLTARDLTARDLTARDLTARDLTARDLTARDLTARDLTARDLTPRDLAGLRAALDEQLRFLRGRPTGASPGVAAPARMVLADVEAALRRMDEGRYGVCLRCRLPVDRKRLRVVPQARYCAPCQHLHATRHRPVRAIAPDTGTGTGAAPGTGTAAAPGMGAGAATNPSTTAGAGPTPYTAGPAYMAGTAGLAGRARAGGR
ncbi:TraR/DksA family transcriptional regulator [Streptomyces sp. CO7]